MFEEGRLDFHADKNQKAAPCLYDITDEMEAYYIQKLFGEAPPDNWVEKYQDMNHNTLPRADQYIHPGDVYNLQDWANQYNVVMRYNGITYMPNVIRKALMNNQ